MNDPGDENDFGHPGFCSALNDAIIDSAIQGGCWLKNLPIGKALKITTRDSVYTLRKQAGGKTYKLEQIHAIQDGYRLSAADNPVIVTVNGSTFGGSMLKTGFIGRGMHMECNLPSQFVGGHRTLTTSEIQEIEEIS